MSRPGVLIVLAIVGCCLALPACASLTGQSHGGIRYSIQPDKRSHRVEKGKDGRLMYDSPELTVIVDRGQMTINGQPGGPVNTGDHVEITDLGTVLVNGERRGDTTTGRQRPERIEYQVRSPRRS